MNAPTLLIVSGDDVEVLALNRTALAKLRCENLLVIVPRRHAPFFEEPGRLGAVLSTGERLARYRLHGPYSLSAHPPIEGAYIEAAELSMLCLVFRVVRGGA